MTLIHLIVLFLCGFGLMNLISPKFGLLEKIGFSFPLAYGLVTLLMLPYDLLGIPITLTSLYIPQLLVIAFAGGWLFYKQQLPEAVRIQDWNKAKSFGFLSINLPWIFLMSILGYLLYVVIAKAMFWPTISFDSVAGYDFVGKMIAIEGKVNGSMFDPDLPFYSIRSGYPLYVPGGFGYAYLMGFDSSKITTVLLILSTVVMYYALLLNYVKHTMAALFTTLFITTTEYIAMSALSLSNVPHTFLAVAAVVTIFIWMDKRDHRYFWLGVIFMALNVWARSDGIVFIAGTGLSLLLFAYQEKKWKELIIFGAVSGAAFMIWQVYLSGTLGITNDGVFVDHLFWDGEKFDRMTDLIWRVITNTQFYGVAMIVIPIGILANFRTIHKQHYHLLIAILVSWLAYTALYYQMDNGGENFGYSLKSMINSSYKRGMFAIIGVLYFYVGISPMTQKLSQLIIEPGNPFKPKQ